MLRTGEPSKQGTREEERQPQQQGKNECSHLDTGHSV